MQVPKSTFIHLCCGIQVRIGVNLFNPLVICETVKVLQDNAVIVSIFDMKRIHCLYYHFSQHLLIEKMFACFRAPDILPYAWTV